MVLSPVSSEPQFPHYSPLTAVTGVLPQPLPRRNTEGDQGPTPGGLAGPHTQGNSQAEPHCPPRPRKTPAAAVGAGTGASRPPASPSLTTATPGPSSILALSPLGGPSSRKQDSLQVAGTTEGRGAGRPPRLGPEPWAAGRAEGGAACLGLLFKVRLSCLCPGRPGPLHCQQSGPGRPHWGDRPRSAPDGPGTGLAGTLPLHPLVRRPGGGGARSSRPADRAGAGSLLAEGRKQGARPKGPG